MAKKENKKPFLSFLIFCVTVAFIGLVAFFAYDLIKNEIYPQKYSQYVEKYADEYGVSETLIYSVIKTESGFKKDAVSSVGARGLTQITEETFDWLLGKTGDGFTFDDLFEPEVSIKYGTFFLSILLKEYGNTETAIAAYHAGMGNVSSWLGDPDYSDDGVTLKEIPISNTAHYVNKVTKAMEIYTKLYGGTK